MTLFESFKLAVAKYKDCVSEETKNQLIQSYLDTLAAEADARRSKIATDIITMNRLKIAVKKLEFQYSKIIQCGGRIEAVERLIADANKEIRLISLHKNKSNKFI